MSIWIPKIVAIQQMVDEPGNKTFNHKHSYVQAGYVLSGTLKVELAGGVLFELSAGDFFTIAQGQKHIIATVGDEKACSIDLRFKAGIFDVDSEQFDIQGSGELASWMTRSFCISRRYTRRIRNRLMKMLKFAQAPPEIQNFILPVKLLQLSVIVSTIKPDIVHKLKNISDEHRAVIRAMDIVYSSYHRRLNVADLAKQAGVSVWHLSKLFRKHTGLTVQQFIAHHRIYIAKKLIMKEAFQLKEIAYKTGFPNIQQFSRTFKRIEGYSPSQFVE